MTEERRDWRELCVAVANEQDQVKLFELLEDLLVALDEREVWRSRRLAYVFRMKLQQIVSWCNKAITLIDPKAQPWDHHLVSRLVQECLTNIHRHSESKSAQICISREAKELSLVVQVTASAANTCGFLLTSLSKTPRIEILLHP
jgi:hypothetical protein